jgi:ATP-dependent DNA ligase
VVFDLLYLDGRWLGDTGFLERYKLLKGLKLPVEVSEVYEGNLMELFERSRTMPLTEGIVVKHRKSGLNGDPVRCTDNGLWNKVKWRR